MRDISSFPRTRIFPNLDDRLSGGKILNLFVPFSAAESQSYCVSGIFLEDSLGSSPVPEKPGSHPQDSRAGRSCFAWVFLSRRGTWQDARSERRTAAEEHYREISAFTASIAHEIRIPEQPGAAFRTRAKKGAAAGSPRRCPGKTSQKISRAIDQFWIFSPPADRAAVDGRRRSPGRAAPGLHEFRKKAAVECN